MIMGGLFGFLRRHPQDSDRNNAIVRAMQGKMLHEDWYETGGLYLGRSACMGLIKSPGSPNEGVYHDKARNQVLAFEGSLHGFTNPEKEKGKGHPYGKDAELIKTLSDFYARFGAEVGHRMKGEFNLLIYHPDEARIRIINDRFGYRNLYYAETPEAFVFASEVKAVVEHPGVNMGLDELALADFFNIGYVFGCKTLFKGVKLMEPGSVLEVSAAGVCKIKSKPYWELRFVKSDSNLDELIEEGYDLFTRDVERRIKGKQRIFVPLSGGLDSRIILQAVCKGADPGRIWAMTWGSHPNCIDHQIARQVARSLHVEHHTFQILGPEFIWKFSPKQIWLTDGLIRGTSSQQLFLVERVGREIDVWLNGILGGNYTFGTSNVYSEGDIREPRYEGELEDHAYERYRTEWGLFQAPLRDLVLHKDLAISLDGRVRESIRDAAKFSLSNSLLCDQKVHFKHMNMSRRLMNNVAVQKGYVDDQKVFYDYDLLDFYAALPPLLRTEHRFYKAMMLKKCSSLSRIPWQSTLRPLDDQRTFLSVWRDFEERFKRRVLKETRGWVEPIKRREYLDFNYWFRRDKRFREYLTGVLMDKRAVDRGIFKQSGILRLFDLQMRGANHMGEIFALYTYEIFARQFLDRDLSDVKRTKIGPFIRC